MIVTQIITTILVILSAVSADDRIKIDFYGESLCSDCQRAMSTSLKRLIYADGFDKMCNLNIWPYGNAHEVANPDGTWSFTC